MLTIPTTATRVMGNVTRLLFMENVGRKVGILRRKKVWKILLLFKKTVFTKLG